LAIGQGTPYPGAYVLVDAQPGPRYSANTGPNSNPRYNLEYLPSNIVGKGYVYFAR